MTGPIGTIFIRLLKMTIMPLVFFSIVCGVASVANLQRLKKVGGTFLVFWLIASLLAALCGIVWSYIIEPGVGIRLAEKAEFSTKGVSVIDSLVKWFPDNPIGSLANFNILQVIIFSLFLGIALAVMPEDSECRKMSAKFFEYGNTITIKIVELVMKFAPIGVLCLMADVTGTLGTEVLTGLDRPAYLRHGGPTKSGICNAESKTDKDKLPVVYESDAKVLSMLNRIPQVLHNGQYCFCKFADQEVRCFEALDVEAPSSVCEAVSKSVCPTLDI